MRRGGRVRDERGQATVEYVGLVLLVAAVLAVAGAAIAGGPEAIAQSVTRSFARALCIVGGGTCDADLQPCVRAGDTRTSGWHVRAFFVQFGHDQILVREERSDGTVALTKTTKQGLGLADSVGLKVSGLVDVSVGAAIMANHGTGSTWIVRSVGEADRLEATIKAGGDMPAPDSTVGSWGSQRSAGAGASIARSGLHLGYDVSDDDATMSDAATGQRTVSIDHKGTLDGSLLFKHGGAGTGVDLDKATGEQYSLLLDADGTPRELVVTDSGTLSASAKNLPGFLDRLVKQLGVPASGGRTWSVDAHLDLSDPEVAGAVAGFIDEIEHPRPHIGTVEPSEEIRRLIDDRAIINSRSYSVSSSSGGASADGEGFGAGYEKGETETQLVAASSRGLDGMWRVRDDCLGSA